MSGPIVHVGYPKAASTFLQAQIFPRIEGYRYVTDRTTTHKLSKRYWFEYQDEFHEQFDGESNYIISREHIFSPIFSMLDGENYEHRNKALANLGHFFRDKGTILVVLRRQDSLIESHLKFKVTSHVDETRMFMDFRARQPLASLLSRSSPLLLNSFDFCGPLVQLAGVMGRDRIKVLLFEDIAERPQHVLEQLGEMFGQDLGHLGEEAKSKVHVSSDTAKIRHPYVAALDKRLGGLLEKVLPARKVALSEQSRRELMEIYAPGNKTLFEFMGLENRYGYY